MEELTISVTKPKGKLAQQLAAQGITIQHIEEDHGNVDRYVLSKRVAVERRTGGSFLSGIMDKTLFASAIYLREHFEVPVLIVEGEVNYAYTAFSPQAVRGALASMMLVYHVTVLSTAELDETAALVSMMARQEQVGVPEISLVPKRAATSLPDMQRRIVEMLPGCGRVLARELLYHFGSVDRIVDATEAELRVVRGIGAKKAAEMHRTLHAEYEAVDTERQLEDAIEAQPGLLFEQPVKLLARQHYIFSEQGERHIVDLVFWDPEADVAYLVELKRGRLAREHKDQLARYLDHAGQSSLLGPLQERGTSIQGILATIEESKLRLHRPDISVRFVDRALTIDVLKKKRAGRLGLS